MSTAERKTRADYVPEEDRAIFEQVFEKQKDRLPGKEAKDFVNDMVWRIYTEICCNLEERPRYPESHIHGVQALTNWLNREAYFAVEKKEMNHDQYVEVRKKIAEAAARRAIELFSTWGGTYPHHMKEDTRNLRSPLIVPVE